MSLSDELKQYSNDLVESSDAYDRGAGGVLLMVPKVKRMEEQLADALHHIECLVIFASGAEAQNAPHTVEEASKFLMKHRGPQ